MGMRELMRYYKLSKILLKHVKLSKILICSSLIKKVTENNNKKNNVNTKKVAQGTSHTQIITTIWAASFWEI